MSKKKRIGLALGAGAAFGLAHIGILKVLHKNKIYPDYIAGTSMGAAVGALYAAGNSPEEIEMFARTTNWKEIMDFTVPKTGLIKGELVERKLRKLVGNKVFDKLNLPLRVVACDLETGKEVVFSKGDVAKAVRASISVPGVFTPVRINKREYIDGGVVNPTPFDVVRKMGAEVVIAVDLYSTQEVMLGPDVKRENSLIEGLKEKFIAEELLNTKNYLFPSRWPKIVRVILEWAFDKLLYPIKVIKIIAKRESLPIVKTMHRAFTYLVNNLSKERLKNADAEIIITPAFGDLDWTNLEDVETFIEIGEEAMEEKIRLVKKIV